MTGVKIVVYGKTVSLIGELEKVNLVKRAVEMLLSGSLHSTVYRLLEKQAHK
jgi:ribosomal RNA assembly protein